MTRTMTALDGTHIEASADDGAVLVDMDGIALTLSPSDARRLAEILADAAREAVAGAEKRATKPTKTQIDALRVYAGESSGYATRAAYKHLLERGWIRQRPGGTANARGGIMELTTEGRAVLDAVRP